MLTLLFTNFKKYMSTALRKWIKVLIVSPVLFAACSKKDMPNDSVPANNATGDTKTTYNMLDSIFLYAKQLYYWNTSLPSYSSFQPRNYNTSVSGNDMDKGTKEIFDLSRYAINPATGLSYEYYPAYPDETKYSYIEKKDADLNGSSGYVKSNVTLKGIGNDLGFGYPVLFGDSSFVFRLFYNNGPAYNAGLRRGNCIVTTVNGRKFSTSDTTFLNAALNSSSITLGYLDTLGVSHSVQLTQAIYKSNPILADTVLNYGAKKIGYMALLNFADTTTLRSRLITLFSNFNSAGVTDLVVDLRYNGGGMVETSAQLANLIAPSSLSGKKMFYENYNSMMQNGTATLLKQIPQDDNPSKSYFNYSWTPDALTTNFNSTGSANLSLNNVCFLVSDGTASASELLINNLKPYMNVKLIGTTLKRNSSTMLPSVTTTFGKPVGFFPIPIGDYDVFIPEFESRNSNNVAVPYSGMTCDVTDWDDLLHALGDHREDGMAQAINYIVNGQFLTQSRKIGSRSDIRNSATTLLNVIMSKSGGISNSVSIPSFQPFLETKIPTEKGLIETFKTIKRFHQ